MFGSYFAPEHQLTLGVAILLLVVAVWLEQRGRHRASVLVMTTAALVLRLFAATFDPFLNQWDECFHAVVAKNMIEDPFTPRLYTDGVIATTKGWTQAGVWLHKPPFFLWQIAISLSIFGPEPWAVRIPSALWLTALVPVTYRIGFLLTGHHRAAWTAALLTTCSYYLLELTAGAITTDHNDAVFIGAVACSWWTLLELWNDGRMRWALFAGFFAACAILTKLFVGALVFVPWVLVIIIDRDRQGVRRLLAGAGVALMITIAWFGSLYLRSIYGLQEQWAFKMDHLSQAMDGHEGDATYHFNVIDRLLTPLTWWVVIPCYALLVWKAKRRDHRILLLALFLLVHLVFAWADTKMVSYTMVLFPLYLVAVGSALVTITDVVIVERFRRPILIGTSALLSGLFLNLEVLQFRHTLATPPKAHQQWRQQQIEAMPVLAALSARIADPERSVVYHVPALHHIQFMFNTGIGATDQMPTAADVERARANGFTVYAVQDGVGLERFPTGVVMISDQELRFPDVGRPD